MIDEEYGNKCLVLDQYRVYPAGEKPYAAKEVTTSRDVAFIMNPDARTLDDIADDIKEIEELWFH